MADKVLFNSHTARSEFETLHPFLKGKSRYVPNGIEVETFLSRPGYDERPVKNPPRLLVVSRLVADKNPLSLVTALAALKSSNHTVPHVTWIGPLSDLDLKQTVDAQLEHAGLVDHW